MRQQRWPAWLGFVLAAFGLAAVICTSRAGTAPETRQSIFLPELYRPLSQFAPIGRTQFGLVFVNSAENLRSDARIQRGVEAGAQLDRFPLYWNHIERNTGQFDWSRQDAALRANERKGLGTLAILLGTPSQYYPPGFHLQGQVTMPPIGGGPLRAGVGELRGQGTCDAPGPPPPRGLNAPIFADGSDRPAPGKAVNPDNPWARFVWQAVERYRPGGSAALHVRAWEIWNEPDLCQFWFGTAQEYARLLKVAYLIIKQSDPQATVVWGGLAHFQQPQFLTTLVGTLQSDPLAAEFGGFFDAAASHHYSTATHGYNYTRRIRDTLAGTPWANKPIWITESGVPICDDYPGPPCPSPYRANPEEQAAYIWQNVAYTRLAGGGPIFHFQLHDDCGNVVAPNSPDGFGLVKNEPASYCSPSNAEPRPAYTAFQLATRFFAETEVLWADIQDGKVRRVAFYHPDSKERRLLVWAIDGDDAVARVPATGAPALRLALDGRTAELTPTGGEYQIPVPHATNRNQPGSSTYTIGGKPYLLIERDTLPPTSTVAPLAPTLPPTFEVSWQTSDLGSGVAEVALWRQEDEGQWQLWLADQPASGSAQFTGQVGHRYRFAVMAMDRAGNAPQKPVAQAETVIAAPTATPTATATATATPTATAVPDGGDLIQNGGFERDELWLFGDNGPATGGYITSTVHSGLRAARLGLEPPAADLASYSSVSQRVTIPSDITGARLALWLWPRTEDDVAPPGGLTDGATLTAALQTGAAPAQSSPDRQQVILLDDKRQFLALLWSAAENGDGWQRLDFDLSDYRGRTIWIYVNSINDGDGRRTWLFLDDVSLTVSRSPSPTATPTASGD
ncbi:MAG: hypothetical protein M5U01_36545 [Ardenticatenaceae bacterium]|nr:hypothetical protein [Ardenticatenaceae bacterium]